jgi:hypothetical protein
MKVPHRFSGFARVSNGTEVPGHPKPVIDSDQDKLPVPHKIRRVVPAALAGAGGETAPGDKKEHRQSLGIGGRLNPQGERIFTLFKFAQRRAKQPVQDARPLRKGGGTGLGYIQNRPGHLTAPGISDRAVAESGGVHYSCAKSRPDLASGGVNYQNGHARNS